MALKVGYPDDATVAVTVIGGSTKNLKIPKGDHQLVTKVKDASSQKIQLDVTKNGQTASTIYDLSGLTLEPEPLTVKAEDSGNTAFGKTVSDLQTGITITDNAISGTLHFIKGYNQFNPDNPTDQQGRFLALNLQHTEGYSVTPEVVGDEGGSKKVATSGDLAVFRISNNTTQSISITAQRDSSKFVKNYSLTGLVLEQDSPAGDEDEDDHGVV